MNKRSVQFSSEIIGNLSNFNYEGRSINKLQNGAIPLNLNRKNQNIRFVGINFENTQKFFDDDIITVTSFVHITQSICVLFSPPVFYHNSSDKQHRNEKKTNKLNKLMLLL